MATVSCKTYILPIKWHNNLSWWAFVYSGKESPVVYCNTTDWKSTSLVLIEINYMYMQRKYPAMESFLNNLCYINDAE